MINPMMFSKIETGEKAARIVIEEDYQRFNRIAARCAVHLSFLDSFTPKESSYPHYDIVKELDPPSLLPIIQRWQQLIPTSPSTETLQDAALICEDFQGNLAPNTWKILKANYNYQVYTCVDPKDHQIEGVILLSGCDREDVLDIQLLLTNPFHLLPNPSSTRKKGIGSCLINFALANARKENRSEVHLVSLESSLRFYELCGFRCDIETTLSNQQLVLVKKS